ncbi:hypothetical protein HBH64_184220 [Parastagonospora nodorum]|nr:hypothetical protein HBI01_182260 [Parastagonospora nodorum]KAH4479733.1 hypothetical protein HBH88_186300 [Parastagonospora nodorum]KAH4581464.1 hypothetical protein HBH83_172250 [Parastagonospora nodorum]KAH4656716.1 hypothetical protein HBH80_158750 [Parastagonospora nodorum]KAH4663144.1 hypothetical protein HBH79_178980 [Parastagonospora nodorum]
MELPPLGHSPAICCSYFSSRYANPEEEKSAAVGKMCEPREKSQRVRGRERDAGWDFSRGMEKRERGYAAGGEEGA